MTTFRTSKFPVLIIGGTGKTGRRVAERLTAQGVPVRIGSRNASPAFDWENPETWAPALECVSAAYITYYPDLAAPGAAEAIGDLARLAVAKGVKRLVLLSGRGEPEAQRAEADAASLRRRLDHRPRQLVHAELQRKHAARPDPRRRNGAAGQHGARTLHPCR